MTNIVALLETDCITCIALFWCLYTVGCVYLVIYSMYISLWLILLVLAGCRKVGPEADIEEYESLRDYVSQVEYELGVQNKVRVLPAPGGPIRTTELISEAIASLPDDVIVMTSTLTTDLSPEFIYRVRTNTVRGRQVFAPIAFWEYAPQLVYSKPRPDHVDVSRNTGHFGERWYDHLAFFSDDYKAAIDGGADKFAEPIDVLTSLLGVEVLRVPEPHLLVRNYSPACLDNTLTDRPKCSMQFLDNLGSGPILAKSLLRDGLVNGKDAEQ